MAPQMLQYYGENSLSHESIELQPTEERELVGERILLVETSGLDEFHSARDFYSKCGFASEARVRDFYNAGEDKLIFRKAL